MNQSFLVKSLLAVAISLPAFTVVRSAPPPAANLLLPGGADKWELVWSDDFDYPDAELNKRWDSQNGPNKHILCSRWRENAVVANGTLKLVNKKENRGGQEWTSGSISTKEQFLYGYYECRYKYAAAQGTNNSFWLMGKAVPPNGKRFEIDINEGHYPNEIATNIHNWTDITQVNGKNTHPSASKGFSFGVRPDCKIQLEIPVTTRKIRFTSTHGNHFHLGEFRIYNVNPAGYPDPFSPTADTDVKGLVNFARDPKTTITVSGFHTSQKPDSFKRLVDGKPNSTWISQKEGDKWIEFTFDSPKTVGCIQFLNGYLSKGEYAGLISNYKVQYHNGKDWVDMSVFDLVNGTANFAKEFHTYGLEWTPEELVFYFDGKELRREKNEFSYGPTPILLSLAIIPWAGSITDAIDGTAMEVDYVRVYKRKDAPGGPATSPAK